MTSPAERARLRSEMRTRRRSLSDAQRAHAARAFAHVLQRSRLLRPGLHVAVYCRHGAEADPGEIIAAARRRGCTLYLPVITDYRAGRMRFVRFAADAPLAANRYGVLEPATGAAVISIRRLDLVFAPLTAVDERGWRVGSGAGFYDRCLHHLRAGRRWRRPRLIGVAYEFQRVRRIDPAPWDVPLDAVLTERNLYRTRFTARGDA